MILEINKFVLDDYLTSYSVTTKDIESDSGGQSETGYTIRDVVRTGVYTLSVEIQASLEEIKTIQQELKKDKLSVKFLNPTSAQVQTIDMFKQQTGNKLAWIADLKNGEWATSFTLQQF